MKGGEQQMKLKEPVTTEVRQEEINDTNKNRLVRMKELGKEMEKSIRIQEICIKVQIGCLIGLLINLAVYLAYCLLK